MGSPITALNLLYRIVTVFLSHAGYATMLGLRQYSSRRGEVAVVKDMLILNTIDGLKYK